MVVCGHFIVEYMYITLSLRSRTLWWKELELGSETDLNSNLAFTTYYLCDLGLIN